MIETTLDFALLTEIPKDLNPRSFDSAVYQFVRDSHCEDNMTGLMNQTLQSIADTLIFKQPGNYVWAAIEDGNVMAYALTHVSKDVDNTLCYYMTQAWVHPKLRHTSFAKDSLKKLREHAKHLMCRHIIIPSSRGVKGYLRFLGSKWHTYVTLLKEDI